MPVGECAVLAVCLLAAASLAARQDFQEFKRMPENRGQSFGLENFLLQPFNLASQSEPKRRYPVDQSYSLEYQIPNDDFDMRKIVPTLPGASLVLNQDSPVHDIRPVHEYPEQIPHSMMPRKRPEGKKQFIVQDSRRPLEKPSEFMLSIMEHEAESGPPQPPPPPIFEEPPPERHRKRVMKRRKKKPTTPAPEPELEIDQERQPSNPLDIQNGFVPTNGMTNDRDSEGKETQTRFEYSSGKRQRLPTANRVAPVVRQSEDEEETPAPEATVIARKPPQQFDPEDLAFTTMAPQFQQPTQKLKNLLKQQNGQLSLSEILQTQNLSLSDLLKGNPGALSLLGGNKINMDNNKSKETRTYIPKISNRSRPFMKPVNNTRNSAPNQSEENISVSSQELPKKLQIIEVTTERYNGFTPKNPRIRQKFDKNKNRDSAENVSKNDVVEVENKKEISSNEIKPTEVEMQIEEQTIDNNESLQRVETSSSTSTTTTTTTLQPIVNQVREGTAPKRYDYRNKLRGDRRRPNTESTSTTSETTFVSTSSTTETQKATVKDPRNRVRIPFMSVNNPEISVIVPNKKFVTSTSTERTSPVIKDRINLFKKINSEEKEESENIVEKEISDIETRYSSTTPLQPTTASNVIETINDTSDELLELLKTGNNEARLQRILDARNMTIGELVEKRANSSKQPNVTHLFKISQPKIPVTPLPTAVPSTSTESKIGKYDLHKKSSETKGVDQLFVEESMISPVTLLFEKEKKEENRESKAYESIPKEKPLRPSINLSPGKEGKSKPPIPLWNVDEKTIYNSNPYGYPTYEMNKNLAGVQSTTESAKASEDIDAVYLETITKNVEANNRLKSNINDILKEVERVEVSDSEKDKHSGFIPPAVKSAVIASAVVMGIALLLFVAIFAACGWKQRQFRLRARSSILNDSLNGSPKKSTRRTGTLSPVSFKRSSLYKKSIDFEDTESSISGSSNTSSYLWNTLKHTFQSRNSTLKNRQEKEEKIQERENRSRRNTLVREDERVERPRRNTLTLSPDEVRRESEIPRRAETMLRDGTRGSYHQQHHQHDSRRFNSLLRDNERCSFKKIDPDRNIIQTSVNFKRGGFNGSSRHFDTCQHFN